MGSLVAGVVDSAAEAVGEDSPVVHSEVGSLAAGVRAVRGNRYPFLEFNLNTHEAT